MSSSMEKYRCKFCGTEYQFRIDDNNSWSRWTSDTYCPRCGFHYDAKIEGEIIEIAHRGGRDIYKKVGKYYQKV